jgi:biopolymer transport protein ExbB
MLHRLRIALPLLAALLPAWLPSTALAWWNPDWPVRARIVLDTGAAGAAVAEPVSNLPLAVRLHGGNFDFLAAKPDGSDLRVVAGDDKTPLSFRIERFDPVNELAVLWVLMPTVAPGSNANVVHVYAGHAAAPAAEPGTGADGAMLAAFDFSAADGADRSGRIKPARVPTLETNGLLGGAMRSVGTATEWAADDSLRAAAGGAYTVSAWFRVDAAVAGTIVAQGPVALMLEEGKLIGRISNARLEGPAVAAGAWRHAALALGGGEAVLYVDGKVAARAEAPTPLIEGPLRAGAQFTGLIDALQVAGTARPAPWLALTVASQGIGAQGLSGTLEREGEAPAEDGGHGGYMGVLVDNLTVDAWVVIIILGVMFVISVWVMLVKAMLVARIDKDNRSFIGRFRSAKGDFLTLDQGAVHANSSLFRLYGAGLREIRKRFETQGEGAGLTGASMDAIKASIDADLVRESHKLNSQMVLLTIAISGGPFLGLLGTVVGVMITFAAIAAAGDVNVNAIAPGIAAALLATVAGLAVAIPALFGYNYLSRRASRTSAPTCRSSSTNSSPASPSAGLHWDPEPVRSLRMSAVDVKSGQPAVRRHQRHADAGPGLRAAGGLHHPDHRVGAGRAGGVARDAGGQQPRASRRPRPSRSRPTARSTWTPTR